MSNTPPANKKWNAFVLVQIYRLLREGLTDTDVARSIGIDRPTYYSWIKKHPELRQTIELVEKEREDSISFPKWVYKHLPTYLQELWDEIERCHAFGSSGIEKIELLLSNHGKRARQQLFLYALCMNAFNPSEAMRRVNISKRELEVWKSEADFGELVDEIMWHKGNYFEQKLVDLCEEGNPVAIIFANKTLNSKRGYANTSQVNVNHSGAVLHGVLDLTELMPYLKEEERMSLLRAVRQREEDKAKQISVIPATVDITADMAEQIAQTG